MVGQVDSQSRPGTSVGVGKITLCKPLKCLRGSGRWDLILTSGKNVSPSGRHGYPISTLELF